jgi:O-antigen ligase
MTGATHARPHHARSRLSPPIAIGSPSAPWLPTAAVALAVIGLAFNSGSFGVMTRNPVAVGLWWLLALGVALSLFPVARLPRAALAAGGLLAAYACLVGLSVAWADNAEGAFDDFTRDALYLGVFAVGVLAVRRGDARRWIDGLAIGITGVALLALAARLFPSLIDAAKPVGEFQGDVRPSWPIDYWNALAVFTALAFPGLLRLATSGTGRLARGLAVAPAPALIALVYLTSSRTGVAAIVVGLACFLVLTQDRGRAIIAILAAGLGSAIAVAVLVHSQAIVGGPLDTSAAAREGRVAALAILAACALSGVLYAALSTRSLPVPRIPRRWRKPLVAAAALVLVAVAVAADPVSRFDSFKQPPPQLGQRISNDPYAQAHLLSGGGNGRWQFWTAAVDQWRDHPVLGGGSGSYGAWWAQHGQLSYVTRDAHSLYLEALGELGPLGLLLLLSLVGVGLAAGYRRSRAAALSERPALVAATATFAAFAVAAGLDWMWEIPAVTAVGLLALALVVGPATALRSQREKRYLWARLAFVGVGLAVIVAQMIPLLAQTDIQRSQSAASRGDLRPALADARDARGRQPWASSPRLQVALVDEQAGNLPAARRAIDSALDRDRSDWRLWMVAARIDARAGARVPATRELAEAKRLNPHSKVLVSVERQLAPVLRPAR